MVKKIQGAAAKETLQGAGRISSSWESLQSRAEREKTWRGRKQVKGRHWKYPKGKKKHGEILCQSHWAGWKDFPEKKNTVEKAIHHLFDHFFSTCFIFSLGFFRAFCKIYLPSWLKHSFLIFKAFSSLGDNSLLKQKLGRSSSQLWPVCSCQYITLKTLLVDVLCLNSCLKNQKSKTIMVRKKILSRKHRAIFSATVQMQTDDSFSTNMKHSQLLTRKQGGDQNFDTSSYQMCIFYTIPLGNLIWTVIGNTMLYILCSHKDWILKRKRNSAVSLPLCPQNTSITANSSPWTIAIEVHPIFRSMFSFTKKKKKKFKSHNFYNQVSYSYALKNTFFAI